MMMVKVSTNNKTNLVEAIIDKTSLTNNNQVVNSTNTDNLHENDTLLDQRLSLQFLHKKFIFFIHKYNGFPKINSIINKLLNFQIFGVLGF